jgi:hypothetical protein
MNRSVTRAKRPLTRADPARPFRGPPPPAGDCGKKPGRDGGPHRAALPRRHGAVRGWRPKRPESFQLCISGGRCHGCSVQRLPRASEPCRRHLQRSPPGQRTSAVPNSSAGNSSCCRVIPRRRHNSPPGDQSPNPIALAAATITNVPHCHELVALTGSKHSDNLVRTSALGPSSATISHRRQTTITAHVWVIP